MELSDLEKKTVTELREMAAPYEDLVGVTGMKKEQLIDVLCSKLGIEKKHALPTGIGRRALKQKIRALKKRRDEALAAHDARALKRVRTLLRRTKHRLRDVVEHAARAEAAAKPKGGAAASPAS
jgi:hypothetical protein